MDLVFSTSVKTTGTHCDRKEAVLVTIKHISDNIRILN